MLRARFWPPAAACWIALALGSACAGREERLLAVGNVRLAHGDVAGALDAFRQAVAADPRSLAAHTRQATALFEAQR